MASDWIQNWHWLNRAIGDALFGRFLSHSQDAALMAAILATVALLLLVRRLLARQSVLRDASLDLRTLRTRIRNTPRGEKHVRKRYRMTRARVARLRLRAELPSALVSLLLVAGIIDWCWQRLQFAPPRPGDHILLRATVPASEVGSFVHVVPQPWLTVRSGYVRTIQLVRGQRPAGTAEWLVTPIAPGSRAITIRSRAESLRHSVSVGKRFFAPIRQRHSDDYSTEVVLKPYRPFGISTGAARLGLPDWFLAYFVVVLAGYLGTRRLLGWY